MTGLEHDPGFAYEEYVALGRPNRYFTGYEMPPMIGEEVVVDERRESCADSCYFAQRCEVAKRNTYKDWDSGGRGAHMEFDNPGERLEVLFAQADYRDERNRAIAGIEAGITACSGVTIRTVETTFEDPAYAAVATQRFGRLKQRRMRSRGEDRVTLSREIVTCNNPAASDAIKARVDFSPRY